MINPHISFDLETHDSTKLWSMGPEFFRVGGYSTGEGVHITDDGYEIVRALQYGVTLTGHNIFGFDLLVLAKNFGLDIIQLAMADKLRDTMTIAFLDDPPPARMQQGHINKYYSLDQVSDRLFGGRKHVDVTKQLVREYGSWGEIPKWDPRFQVYIDQDVALAGEVADRLCGDDRSLWPYALREHRLAAICAQITLNGFRVDHDEVIKRVDAGRAKRAQILRRLTADYGLPTTRKDGGPSTAPQNTQAGRQAVKKAFEVIGAKYMPKTPQGAWATGKEAMEKMIAHYGTDKGGLPQAQQDEIVALAETIQELNGVRTVYETVFNNMVRDEFGWRVHPNISGRQASGRFSFTKPGLTVMGKRGGRHVEREIFLPEPGHVIISADLSQIDARAVAVLSQDRGYMELFGPDRDLHAEVAKRVFGTEKMREQVKPLNHGYNYGLGMAKAIDTLGVKPDVVRRFYREMREQFPRLNAWKNEMAEIAESGRLLDNGFGRKMRPDRFRGHTQGPALMGQGCARDLICEGILRLPHIVHPMLRGIIHDEVVLSCPVEVADDVEKIVVNALSFEWAPASMPNARPIQVIADVGKRGPTWGDVYGSK
jgi:DNA polymerase-1